ncbi:MAG: DsbC family protein [Gammaproteobacteria bacterium]|nr:DsbC family protein [Gammaproteobacteria bacterium]
MQQVVRLAVAVAIWMLAGAVHAADVDKAVATAILEKLQTARPDFVYGEVEASSMPGLYQVQVEQGPLLYVSEDGSYVLTGKLYGVIPGGFVDMQELAMMPIRRDKLAAIPASEEVIFSPKGKRKAAVYVFTDVDCGYCRKLHKEVPELNAMGIEVRYLAFPRAGIDSPSHKKIAQAWCAKDRQTTLTKLKNLEKVDVAYCNDNPIAKQYKLGNELGVRGTPAIFLEDGTLLPGYMPAADLAQRMGL